MSICLFLVSFIILSALRVYFPIPIRFDWNSRHYTWWRIPCFLIFLCQCFHIPVNYPQSEYERTLRRQKRRRWLYLSRLLKSIQFVPYKLQLTLIVFASLFFMFLGMWMTRHSFLTIWQNINKDFNFNVKGILWDFFIFTLEQTIVLHKYCT